METKKITIEIDEASAKVVVDMLEFFNLHNLKEAEKKDPFKDNTPYIKAIENFIEAYKKASNK